MQPIPTGNGATPRKKRNFSTTGVDIRRNPAILKDITRDASPSSSGLGHRVLIPATWVRLPLEMPILFSPSNILARMRLFSRYGIIWGHIWGHIWGLGSQMPRGGNPFRWSRV